MNIAPWAQGHLPSSATPVSGLFPPGHWFLWNLYGKPYGEICVFHAVTFFFLLKIKSGSELAEWPSNFGWWETNNSLNSASLLNSFPWKHYQHDLRNSDLFKVDFAGVQKTANSILKRSQQRISRICGKKNKTMPPYPQDSGYTGTSIQASSPRPMGDASTIAEEVLSLSRSEEFNIFLQMEIHSSTKWPRMADFAIRFCKINNKCK